MKDYSELNEGIYANMETSKGDILLELFYKKTPLTVSNFVPFEGNHPAAAEEYSGKAYYDGQISSSYRNFMIQVEIQLNRLWRTRISAMMNLHEFKHGGILSMANAGPGKMGQFL